MTLWNAANARRIRMSGFVMLTIASIGLGGCNNNKKKEEELRLADLESQNTTLRDENERLNTELTQSRDRTSSLESEAASLREAAARPAAPATDTAGTQSRDRVLTIAGDVAFAPGSATLTSAGRRELDVIISTIRSQYSGNQIEIAGFTDDTPLRKSKGKWTDNENLSAQRALAVERYMNSKGVPDSQTHIAGYGSARPKSSKKESRRVEIKILAN